MDREKLFEEFIKECEEHEEICGQGNPNADILLIGQEPAAQIDLSISENHDKYLESIRINHELCRDEKLRDSPRPKRNEKTGKLNTTWQNYQRLINRVYGRTSAYKDKYDFEKYAFTSELGNMARKHSKTDLVTRTAIKDRLELIKHSDFLQSFPVIILACGPYINNIGVGDERAIDCTFEVEFDGHEMNKYEYCNGVRFFLHHNVKETKYFKEGKKLVIHTRQFGRIVPNVFLDNMANIICEHLNIK